MIEEHPLSRFSRASGKTVMAIAKDAGCSRMTLYRLMRGEQNATIDLLQRVSAATGGEVSVSDLFPAHAPAPAEEHAQ
jgi:DNA-binding phage protein